MTEAEWLACNDPTPMLAFLRLMAFHQCHRISDRKVRLFAAACCRRIWDVLSAEQAGAVEIAERFADGQSSIDDLQLARKDSRWSGPTGLPPAPEWPAYPGWVASHTENIVPAATESAIGLWDEKHAVAPESAALIRAMLKINQERTAQGLAISAAVFNALEFRNARHEERSSFARQLRCIVGLKPFRPASFSDSWRTATVLALAQAIYIDRAFDRLPILADALEDAGCTNRDLLDHCRRPGAHVRGCWVVDLALGKE